MGGMGIGKPGEDCKYAHQYSKHVSRHWSNV
jgi:hypothetical protein